MFLAGGREGARLPKQCKRSTKVSDNNPNIAQGVVVKEGNLPQATQYPRQGGTKKSLVTHQPGEFIRTQTTTDRNSTVQCSTALHASEQNQGGMMTIGITRLTVTSRLRSASVLSGSKFKSVKSRCYQPCCRLSP